MIEILFTIAIAHFIIANLIALFLLGAASRSVRERWQQTLRPEAPDLVASPLTLPLSAIVPAFNEQEAIVNSVLAILDSGVLDLEIIVIDDGSVDETAARLTSRFDMMIVEATHPEPLKTARVEQLLRSRVPPNLWLIR